MRPSLKSSMTSDVAELSLEECSQLAKQLRVDSIRCTTQAGSGHPTSSMSAADLMAVLAGRHFGYDVNQPKNAGNDRLIFSKGHASPLLYALFHAMGMVDDRELLSLRKFGSIFEGHPTPRIPFVDAATGSLGQGLPIAVGMALAAKHVHQTDNRIWVLLGDSEMAEGSIYEAAEAAAYYQLDNLVAIIDVNRLGQRGETELGWNIESYCKRMAGFGWNVEPVDGHDVQAIDQAFAATRQSAAPTAIIARTIKGKGVSFTENADGWHGKALSAQEESQALAELRLPGRIRFSPRVPTQLSANPAKTAKPSAAGAEVPHYALGSKEATRHAYGDALKSLGAGDDAVLVLDAEVSNSTNADIFRKAYPQRYFEMFIAEQLMLSVAQGLSIPIGRTVFCSTFAAFLSRAFDQIRMAAVSGAKLRICGSHAGISIGEDGPSQMGLEDLAMMRTISGSAVLYPADAVATVRLVQAMAHFDGIAYIRTTREKTRVLYDEKQEFTIGGSVTLRRSDADVITLIAAGITLHESLKAADMLQAEGHQTRVIDLYSVKPIDVRTLKEAAVETRNLLVCEDHWAEGGLGDAVLAALAPFAVPYTFTHLAVRGMPMSGKPEELMERFGISAATICAAAKATLSKTPSAQ